MVRALGAFLLLFSILSLVVHLIGMFAILAAAAVAVFVADGALAYFNRASRPIAMRREEIL